MTEFPVSRDHSVLSGRLEAIDTQPWRAFALFAGVHAAVWTLLPTLLYPNLPLDVIEALVYGREWQLGHDKLPPLPWWSVEAAYRIAGADFAYYLLAQVAVLGALALVFATALPIVGTAGALAAVLIVDGIHYFNFTAPKFNHDVIQLPFWALAGFSLHRALRTGRNLYWALLGLAVAGALWSKYFFIVLAGPVGLFILLDPQARRTLATPGPYLAAAIALLVAAPHLIWLVANDFLPFRYAEARAVARLGIVGHLAYPLLFAASQLAWLLPAAFIASPLFVARPAERQWTDAYDVRIVTLLAFGPVAFLLLGSAMTGRGLVTMWGYPLWLFAGLWLVVAARVVIAPGRLRQLVLCWAIVAACYAIAFIVHYGVRPHLDNRYRASLFPGAAIAQHVTEGFRAVTGHDPAYIVSSMWLGGNISHYAPAGRPRVLIDGRPARAPWIDLADLKRRGAVVAWMDSDPNILPQAYATIAGDAEIQPPLSAPLRWKKGTFTIGWAILKPRP